MDVRRRIAYVLLLCGSLMIVQPTPARAQNSTTNPSQTPDRDGVHDFDWDIGTWKAHQKRRLHPLTGSTTWVEYSGTDTVQKIWDGANWGKVESDGPAGHLEIYTLRVYDPNSHEWNIYFTNPAKGPLGVPVVGEFKDGRGEFYDREPYNGKMILVRFRVYDITSNSCHFDQAFSPDEGKTWETNFIVEETLSNT